MSFYQIIKQAAAIQWDPKTQSMSKAEASPSEVPPTGELPPTGQEEPEAPPEPPAPAPIDVETARLQKLLQHSQTRLQLIQTQAQLDNGGMPPEKPDSSGSSQKPKPTKPAKKK